ncbi:hypothetical protein [Actinoplanes sp. NPDC049599]|uniref:hypothetical protein n=1 Tax=Actinoplanes sp. NPDC049599 TaxID=3363903 RepID=UPI0037ABAAFD
MMIWQASARARWTLIAAVAGSVLLIGLTVLALRPDREPPPLAFAEPWSPPSAAEPATFPAEPADPSVLPISPQSTAPASATGTRPPATRRPTTRPPAPTTRPTTPPPAAPNLSLRGDGEADGSTKAEGRSFKDVRDGSLSTFWSPVGVTGEVSIKWPVPVTVSRIRIREAPGGGRIGAWQVRNHDTNAVLAAGSGAGTITFTPVSLRKITFVIRGADGTPRVAEYETFAR